jgi:hypothetical protein
MVDPKHPTCTTCLRILAFLCKDRRICGIPDPLAPGVAGLRGCYRSQPVLVLLPLVPLLATTEDRKAVNGWR